MFRAALHDECALIEYDDEITRFVPYAAESSDHLYRQPSIVLWNTVRMMASTGRITIKILVQTVSTRN